jgi:carbon monoxide dehydrogenase subunit G
MAKINIEGNYLVNSKKERVDIFLGNMIALSKCMKGLEEIKVLNENFLSGKIKVSEGLLRGIFNLEANLKQNLNNVIIQLKMSGTLGRAQALINIETKEISENKTMIEYKAEVDVGGLGAILSKKQIYEISDKILKDIFDCFNTYYQ